PLNVPRRNPKCALRSSLLRAAVFGGVHGHDQLSDVDVAAVVAVGDGAGGCRNLAERAFHAEHELVDANGVIAVAVTRAAAFAGGGARDVRVAEGLVM